MGQVTRVADATGVTAANVAGNGAPDLVVAAAAQLAVLAERRHLRARQPDPDRGRASPAANLVFNAGDWDRDGDGDIIVRNTRTAP